MTSGAFRQQSAKLPPEQLPCSCSLKAPPEAEVLDAEEQTAVNRSVSRYSRAEQPWVTQGCLGRPAAKRAFTGDPRIFHRMHLGGSRIRERLIGRLAPSWLAVAVLAATPRPAAHWEREGGHIGDSCRAERTPNRWSWCATTWTNSTSGWGSRRVPATWRRKAAAYRPPTGAFLVARCADAAIGCGAIRAIAGDVGELSACGWRQPSEARASGPVCCRPSRPRLGRLGYGTISLDSRRELAEATALYLRAGYREVPAYNDNRDADVWFEKGL